MKRIIALLALVAAIGCSTAGAQTANNFERLFPRLAEGCGFTTASVPADFVGICKVRSVIPPDGFTHILLQAGIENEGKTIPAISVVLLPNITPFDEELSEEEIEEFLDDIRAKLPEGIDCRAFPVEDRFYFALFAISFNTTIDRVDQEGYCRVVELLKTIYQQLHPQVASIVSGFAASGRGFANTPKYKEELKTIDKGMQRFRITLPKLRGLAK
jgi:hypothetical protein